ncbi:hypothetical protein FA15DRAFT_663005 [Coprinopsis marcescibilis]|uniref:DRBM domain-containing protein n=1 Tax=Coprinopsis marcescibilis TaxID=230819 RepID=A0A5C3LQB9_COPMA|nr:hypothetical protein FA15DRAFT_663005 [Coprinopsis marcescibilis]
MSGDFPPLLSIQNEQELFMTVVTHDDHRSPDDEEGKHRISRLREVGVQIIHLAFATHFYQQDPDNSGSDIDTCVQSTLKGDIFNVWAVNCDLKRHLRTPTQLATDENQEMRKFFEGYVGAAWSIHGLEKTHKWISHMLSRQPYIKDDAMDTDGVTAPPTGQPSNPNPPSYSAHPSGTSALHIDPNIRKLVTLAAVHEAASKRRQNIEYEASSAGQSHMPIWTVICKVNGEERGRAQDSSKAKAKLSAAQETYFRLGWNNLN